MKRGDSPLILASKEGHATVVRALITSYAEIEITDSVSYILQQSLFAMSNSFVCYNFGISCLLVLLKQWCRWCRIFVSPWDPIQLKTPPSFFTPPSTITNVFYRTEKQLYFTGSRKVTWVLFESCYWLVLTLK